MAEEEEEKVSFANLRSRFESMAAGPKVPIGKPLSRFASLNEQSKPSSTSSFIASKSADKEEDSSISSNHSEKSTPSQTLPDPPKTKIPPAVPLRPLTPSRSLPYISSYPGALEALEYAESGPSSDAEINTSESRPPPIPIRPSVPQGANVGSTSSPAAVPISASAPIPQRPAPITIQKAADEHAKFMARRHHPHSTSDAFKVLSSASHKLADFARHPLPHGSGDERSESSTPIETGTPPSINDYSPKGGQDFLPPPPRRTLHPQPKSTQLSRQLSQTGSISPNSEKALPPITKEQSDQNDDDDGEEGSSSDNDEDVMSAIPVLSSSSLHATAALSEEVPDASRANRRPPHYVPPRTIHSKSHTTAQAVYGDTLVTGHHDKLRIHQSSNNWDPIVQSISLGQERRENRISAIAFRPGNAESSGMQSVVGDGRYIWCGTKEGDVFEFDLESMRVTSHRLSAHTGPVIVLQRVGSNMISIDESGKICSWLAKKRDGNEIPSLSFKDAPVTQRIVMEKYACTMVLGEEVWVASVNEGAGSRAPKVRIYRPFSIDKPFNAVSRPVYIPENLSTGHIGLITSGTIIPLQPGLVFFGHQSGHISIWNRTTYSCMHVQPLSMAGVTALCGVRGHFLWAGSRQGEIRIFDVRERPWQVIKTWQANKTGAITEIIADPSLIDAGKLQVLTSSLEGEINLWDGLLKSDWLTAELERRLKDYSSLRTLTSLHITFNIDAATVMDFEGNELPGLELLQDESQQVPDLIIIGFQELVDLGDTRIMAKSLIMGGGRKNKQADVGERLSHQARAWTARLTAEVQRKAAQIQEGLRYRLVLQDSLVGLYSAIFIREDEMSSVRDPAIATIKTGFGGRMGNKGAIVASLRIDDTPLAFINCHLAAGQRHVRQRNADLVNIFEAPFARRPGNPTLDVEVDAYAGGGDGSMILPDHEVVFLSGDLNYRIDLRKEQCLDWISNNSWDELMIKDQLKRQLNENSGHRLKPFKEAEINFAPTYKFDRQTDIYDTSEKNRVPAYCDRILWYTRSENALAIKCLLYTSQMQIKLSDHRPVIGRFQLQIRKADPKRRKAILNELHGDWQVAQAERLRAAREYYMKT